MTSAIEQREQHTTVAPGFMKANVFRGPADFGLTEKPIPVPGYG